MTTVDSRIVELKFNNSQFEAAVKQTLTTLDTLNKGLKLDGAAKGLGEVDAAVKRFSLAGIASSVEDIKSKFSAMGVVAISVISNITNRAMAMASNVVKSFTIQPITEGLQEYETNLNAIQTILANTAAAGTTLKDVNAALAELNTYSDQTIYNFSEMAKNIGTFTAAGVDLDTATGSIKGIANLAALSGSNATQASTAMYQLSQAISAGRISLQDWNSVQNASMGGTVFQRALAQTAEVMGTLDKGALKLDGKMKNVTISGKSFRESITAKPGQESWLTSEVLTKTLQQFTGDMTDAQLAAEGFSKEQIKAIQLQAKTAKASATEVKTFSQLMGTLKEGAGSGWSQTWQLILGDFEQAKVMWTGVNNALTAMVNASADARNKMFSDWNALGGRTAAIDAVKNAFNGLMSVFKPIKEAFTSIFPPATGKQLMDITTAILNFTKGLTLSAESSDKLKRTFAGVFAIVGIVVEVIKELAGMFVRLTGGADEAAGGVLGITAKIGDFLVKVLDAVREGTALNTFFVGLGNVLKIVGSVILAPIKLLQLLGRALSDSFSKVDSGLWERLGNGFRKFGTALGDFFKNLDMATLQDFIGKMFSFEGLGGIVSKAWDGMGAAFGKAKTIFGPAITAILDGASSLGDSLAGIFKDIDYGALLGTINTGLFAGLVLMIKKFLGGIGKETEKESGGIKEGFKTFIDDITSPFKQLTSTLSEMQNSLKATTLLQIAIAVGILAASVATLSKIDAAGLTRAVTAIGVLFVQLTFAMAAFQRVDLKGGMGQLILVAIALRILTESVEDLAELSWTELAKGLIGTTVLLGALAVTARMMPDGKSMISSSLGIILLAAGIRILVTAVEKIADMSWGEIARGLTGVGALLGALALYSKFVSANKMGVIQGAGIILLAAGIDILAGAMNEMADMSWGEIARGLVAMGGGLAVMAVALKLIPPSSILSAAAIFIVAQSLGKIGDALKSFAEMSWGGIAKSLTLMAGALGIIAGAMALMTAAIPGSLALVIVAAGLRVLTPVLIQLGGMAWEAIAKGLTVLAGALLIIAGAMYLMTAALPGALALIVVAGALAVLAPVMEMFGGMSWGDIAKGLTLLAGTLLILAIGVTAMILALPGALALIVVAGALAVLAPILILLGGMSWEAIGKGLVALAGAFAVIGLAGLLLTPVIPTLLGLGAAIMLLGVGVALAGVGLLAFSVALTALAVSGGAATLVLVGMVTAIIGLLPTLAAAIGRAVISFATVIATAGPQITEALVTVLSSMLDAIVRLTPKITATFVTVMNSLLKTVATYSPKIIALIFSMLSQLLAALVGYVPKLVTAGMTMLTGILNGIAAKIGGVVTAATNVIVAFINGISANLPRIIQSGVNLIINFVNGIANAIRSNTAAMNAAGQNLATAIVQGMTSGISGGLSAVTNAAKNLASSALSAAKNALGIKSPSKEFEKLGKFSAEGYAKGLDGSRAQIVAAQKAMNDMLASTRKAVIADIDKHTERLKTLNKAKKKDIDAIKKTTAALKESRDELKRVDGGIGYSKSFGDEMKKLDALGAKAETVAKNIDEANKKLVDATKTRDDYSKSVQDQYNKLSSVSKETKLTGYVKDLKQQILDTQLFSSQLQELRKRGLNDAMYKELLSKGPDAIPFAKQILEGGKESVAELNTLGAQLSKSATDLGNHASKALYQAAVDSAAGLVKGLKDQQKNIEAEMDNIAAYMVRAIRKGLGIKSPSREFAAIGVYSMQGLAKGLKDTSDVMRATDAVSSGVLQRMRSSLSKLDENMLGYNVLNPTIRPVLDLTEVNKSASAIGKMLATKPIDVGVAYSQAQSTMSALRDSREINDILPTPPSEPVVFNQYNTSPKPLSEAEIYRQTKNQLSLAKGALTSS